MKITDISARPVNGHVAFISVADHEWVTADGEHDPLMIAVHATRDGQVELDVAEEPQQRLSMTPEEAIVLARVFARTWHPSLGTNIADALLNAAFVAQKYAEHPSPRRVPLEEIVPHETIARTRAKIEKLQELWKRE